MGPALRAAFEQELSAARSAASAKDWAKAWTCMERAHVLGQRSTRTHVYAHARMLQFAWRRRDIREFAGQLTRIAGASLLSWIWIPEGNTGGARVSAFRRMPIPADLGRILDEDRT
jgi:hypothetical protein